MSTDKAKFGVRLRTLRAAAGFTTARQFAAALGVNENTYSRYERGENVPRLPLIKKICAQLKVTTDDLYGGQIPLSGHRDDAHDHPGFSESETKAAELTARAGRAPASILSGRRGSGQGVQPDQLSVLIWRFAETYAHAIIPVRRAKKPKDKTHAEFMFLQERAKLFIRLREDLLATIAQLVVSEQLSRAAAEDRAQVQKAADELLRAAMQSPDSSAA